MSSAPDRIAGRYCAIETRVTKGVEVAPLLVTPSMMKGTTKTLAERQYLAKQPTDGWRSSPASQECQPKNWKATPNPSSGWYCYLQPEVGPSHLPLHLGMGASLGKAWMIRRVARALLFVLSLPIDYSTVMQVELQWLSSPIDCNSYG